MVLFDLIMRPADSYWKRQWKAEEIRRKSAEADLDYWRGTCENQKEDLAQRTERAFLQSRALDTLAKEIEKLKKELVAKDADISIKDREIGLLHEALRTERDLNAAMKTNGKLWDSIKVLTKEAAD